MKTINNPKRKVSVTNQRSYFDWTDGMQVDRKRNGEIAITESELVKFFGVTWRKLNHRLKTIMKSSNLHPEERSTVERVIVRDKELAGYASLYPLPIIIALSFQLDSTGAHFFRKYIINELQRPTTTLTPVFLFGDTQH